jgi:hypothetical protein
VHYTEERPIDRRTIEMALTCETAQEPVTVPAGTFADAMKVTCRNSRTNLINFEQWLSPEVRHVVKDRTHFSYGVRERELIWFTLK